LSLVSLILVSLVKGKEAVVTLRQIGLLLAAFVLTCLLTGGFIVARGTLFSGLLHGALLRPLLSVGIFDIPLLLSMYSIVAGQISLAFACVYILQEKIVRLSVKRLLQYVCWIKLGLGVLVLAGGMLKDYHLMLSFCLPFVWLLIVPPIPKEPDSISFPRLLLAMTACLQTLQAFPVAGTQRALATFLFVPIAALFFCDGLSTLRCRFREQPRFLQFKRHRQYGMTILLLATMVSYFVWMRIPALANQYKESTSLGLPGSERIRLPEYRVAEYTWLTENIQALKGTFITIPGYNSLYFWTGQDPPTGFNATTWMTLLNTREQEAVVRSLSAHDTPCVVYDVVGTEFWLRGQDVSESPIFKHIQEEFEVVDRLGVYLIMTRKGSQIGHSQGAPTVP
jgi:hypothetical protein